MNQNSLPNYDVVRYPLHKTALTTIEKMIIKSGFGGIAWCPVCGRFTLVTVTDRNLRENCVCLHCRSTNRQRQQAYVICRCYGERRIFHRLSHIPNLDHAVIYNTEARGPIHDRLSLRPNYICSEFFGPHYEQGNLIDGIMHQDLTDLSLADKSVDLVLSADVLEHVPKPYTAHREIHRILKPGGRHIFTVPFLQTEFLDEVRTRVDESGRLVFDKDACFHDDPLRPEGALVYTFFSLEMLVKLARIGFRPNLYHLHSPFYGIWGPNAIVFEAIKVA